jgi:Sas10/Utp3/C1D family
MTSRGISTHETLSSLLLELREVRGKVRAIRRDGENLDLGHDAGQATLLQSLITDEELLSSIESAKFHTSLAYTLSTLFFVLLSCKGGRTAVETNYPIMQEIERVKLYVEKIRKASTPAEPDRDIKKGQY